MADDWDISYDIDDLIEPENKKKNPFAKTFKEISRPYRDPEDLWSKVTDREPYDWIEDTKENKHDIFFGHSKEAHVVLMSPDKYLKEWEFAAIKKPEEAKRVQENAQAKIDIYKDAMNKGDKFPLPWLRYIDGGFTGQEGYHRANAAKQLGIEKIPVAILDIDTNRVRRQFTGPSFDSAENGFAQLFGEKKKQNPFTYETELI